ncbi:hypothetical protein LTR37_016660 [Vermiconidia calcicola]|uniref:Uncharacterized protein n=1 Tax=Vermiconidia calcicola TaxID=1690605 RepID=A0ACC3MPW1_9PEZI|nr:hypothetical protein LTR37_016660 [Vermiconidia calcicola]
MPGVPPNALNDLKRAFKGMFKRGKKSNNTTDQANVAASSPTPSQQQSTPPPPPPPQQPSTSSSSAAPQLPPLRDASPLQSATEPSKPLPPTHPLWTGRQDEPQEAVPQKHDAQPGPPAPVVNADSAPQHAGIVSQDRAVSRDVSPPAPGSTMDGAKSEVSAVEEPSPVPKTDSGLGAPKVEESAVTHSAPTVRTESVHPNGTTTTSTTATTTTTMDDKPATNGTPLPEQQTMPVSQPPVSQAPVSLPPVSHTSGDMPPQSEEKVAVTMEEPPPIKTVRAAPGMSATSGPLEDFPEGGGR